MSRAALPQALLLSPDSFSLLRRLSPFLACFAPRSPGRGRRLGAASSPPNFIVFGETAEGRVREVAEEFERFRDALGRVIPGADEARGRPDGRRGLWLDSEPSQP